jgi:hypothetical protein
MTAVPETLRQARRWDEMAAQYLRTGMHDVCAAQMAWGRQLGMSKVRPACDECARMRSLPGSAGPTSSDPATPRRATNETGEAA